MRWLTASVAGLALVGCGQTSSSSSERTARKVRPPLGVFRRLAGVVQVGAVLPPLSYFYPPSWVIPPSCLIPPTGVGLPGVEAEEESELPGCQTGRARADAHPPVCLQAPALHGPRLGTDPRRGRNRKEAAAGRLGIPRSHGYRPIPTFGSNNLTQETGDSRCFCTETAYPSGKRAV